MTDNQITNVNPYQPGQYEIRLQGLVPKRRTNDFMGMTMTHDPNGYTVLRGFLADQSALHGVLNKIRDLNITLISVQQIDPHAGILTISDDEKE